MCGIAAAAIGGDAAGQLPQLQSDLGVVSANTEYTITTSGSDFDTELGLFSVDGFLRDSNDDFNPPLRFSLIGPRSLAPGVYYISASGFDTAFGNTTPFLAVTAPGSRGGNLTLTLSTPVDAPIVRQSFIEPGTTTEGGEIEFYRFQIVGFGEEEFDFYTVVRGDRPLSVSTAGSDFDTEIGVWNVATGDLVAENDDAAPPIDRTSLITFTPPVTPEPQLIRRVRYTLTASGFSTVFDNDFITRTSHTSDFGALKVDVFTEPSAGGLPFDVAPGGDIVNLGFTAAAVFDIGLVVIPDTLASGGPVTIETDTLPLGSSVGLFDGTGALIEADTLFNADASITRVLQPGTYTAASTIAGGSQFIEGFRVAPGLAGLFNSDQLVTRVAGRPVTIDYEEGGDAAYVEFRVVNAAELFVQRSFTDNDITVATCPTGGDGLSLGLYRPDGTLVATGVDTFCADNGFSEEILFENAPRGDYILAVSGSGATYEPNFIISGNHSTENTFTQAVINDGLDAIGVIEFEGQATFTRFRMTCLADVNRDGQLTPADFNAWIAAFNAQTPECDQNGDFFCNSGDFNAWVINFNAGC
ncbi:MAG: GC-type dockerin domain-anchored protein [Planctomycetota bacterium]